MNCKPGDLAVIIHSVCGNEGKIVRCIRLLSPDEIDPSHRWNKSPMWLIDRPIVGTLVNVPHAWDDRLRPIRDPGEDAQDETLAWIPVPAPAREVVHG